MEQLLTIEVVPIQVEFVEKEPLKLSAVQNTQLEVSKESGQNQVQSKPIRIAIQDSFEPSQNYNWENSTYTATSKVDNEGNLQLNLSLEDGEAKSIRFKQANRSIDSMASQASEIEAGSMRLSIPIQSLSAGKVDSSTEFMPPDLELVVTQQPDVIITYVGGPIYFPRSADPNYEPPIGFEESLTGGAKVIDEIV
ncbi:hypothetical protein Q5O24_04350 [Eubacteriaceae bacterium ES3]|nr:hypothetical protein Q5O24_04350 [Eubacteriaceae bacterium ES3]